MIYIMLYTNIIQTGLQSTIPGLPPVHSFIHSTTIFWESGSVHAQGTEHWFQDIDIVKPFSDSTHLTFLGDVSFSASETLMVRVRE